MLSGILRKTRQQLQRERHQTKDLMSKTMAVHVYYNSWYISIASSANDQILRRLENVNQRLLFRRSIWN